METKHTPAPWRTIHTTVVVIAETHGYDTVIANMAGGSGLDEKVANARLTASAPELLEALEGLTEIIRKAGLGNLARGVELGQMSWSVKASDRMDAADRAIAKATGGDHAA